MLEDIYHKISYVKNAKEIVKINKGFSFDKKYSIDGKYLLRLFSSNEEERRRVEFTSLQELAKLSNYVPKAIEFGQCEADYCYMILEFLPGDDGETMLPQLSVEEQYFAGIMAGVELKKLHHVAAPIKLPTWYELKKKKSDKYLQQLQELPVDKSLKILLENYIKKNEHLMEGRPNTFQHDDFHPANLLIDKKSFSGIIDFQRMDWGDPLHDLVKLGFFSKRISLPFTRGVVDGYFQDEVLTNSFWEIYSLYSAMHIVSAIVWGRKMGQQQFETLLNYSLEVLEDHDQFKRMIPKWYSNE